MSHLQLLCLRHQLGFASAHVFRAGGVFYQIHEPWLVQMTECLMCPDLLPRYTKPFLHSPIWWFLNVDRLECSMIFLIKTCWNTVEGCLEYFLVSSGNAWHDGSWYWILSFSLPCYRGDLCQVPPAYWSVYCRAFIMHYPCISLLSVVRSCFGSNFECSISLSF